MPQRSNNIFNTKSTYYPCYISTDDNRNNQLVSPMTNESNSDSYPGLVSSACLSTDTESLAHSQESNSTDIWSKLPVRKYTDENSNKKMGMFELP